MSLLVSIDTYEYVVVSYSPMGAYAGLVAFALVCDRCASASHVRAVVIAAGHSAWTLDLCPACESSLVASVQALIPDANPSQSRTLRRALERGGQPQKAYYAAAEGVSMTEVRAWARANGVAVENTGRVAAEVITAYREARGLSGS